MKAEDTVMKGEQQRPFYERAKSTRVLLDGLGCGDINELNVTQRLIESQAEISFKAGMREVVDWLFERSTAQETDFTPEIIAFTMKFDDWQAFLKEHGLEKR